MGELPSNFEEFTFKALMTSGVEVVEKAREIVGENLGWKAEDGPAEIFPSAFASSAEQCKGNDELITAAAQEMHERFGIPVEDATARIQIAGERVGYEQPSDHRSLLYNTLSRRYPDK